MEDGILHFFIGWLFTLVSGLYVIPLLWFTMLFLLQVEGLALLAVVNLLSSLYRFAVEIHSAKLANSLAQTCLLFFLIIFFFKGQISSKFWRTSCRNSYHCRKAKQSIQCFQYTLFVSIHFIFIFSYSEILSLF